MDTGKIGYFNWYFRKSMCNELIASLLLEKVMAKIIFTRIFFFGILPRLGFILHRLNL